MPFEEYAAQPFNQKHGLTKGIIDICLAKLHGDYAGFFPRATTSYFNNKSSYLYLNSRNLNNWSITSVITPRYQLVYHFLGQLITPINHWEVIYMYFLIHICNFILIFVIWIIMACLTYQVAIRYQVPIFIASLTRNYARTMNTKMTTIIGQDDDTANCLRLENCLRIPNLASIATFHSQTDRWSAMRHQSRNIRRKS